MNQLFYYWWNIHFKSFHKSKIWAGHGGIEHWTFISFSSNNIVNLWIDDLRIEKSPFNKYFILDMVQLTSCWQFMAEMVFFWFFSFCGFFFRMNWTSFEIQLHVNYCIFFLFFPVTYVLIFLQKSGALH